MSIAPMLISVISNFFLVRLLAPDVFGVFALLNVSVGISQWIVNSGLGQFIIYSDNVDDSDYSTLALANYLLGSLLFVFYQIIVPGLSVLLSLTAYIQEMRLIGLVFLLSSISISQRTRATKEMKFKELTWISLGSVIVANIASIYSAYAGIGLMALVIKSLVQTALILFAQLIAFGPIKLRGFNFSRFREMYNYGLPLLGRGLIYEGYHKFLDFTMFAMFGVEQLGWFSEGKKLPNMSSSIASKSINRVAFPALSRLRSDDTQYVKLYTRYLYLIIIISGVISLVFVGFSEQIVSIFYGLDWSGAVKVVLLLAISSSLQIVINFLYTIAKIEGYTKSSLLIYTVKAVFHTGYLLIFQADFQSFLLSFIIIDVLEYAMITSYLILKNKKYISNLFKTIGLIILLVVIGLFGRYSGVLNWSSFIWWFCCTYIVFVTFKARIFYKSS